MAGDTVTQRQLNRTTLQRQLLLERSDRPVARRGPRPRRPAGAGAARPVPGPVGAPAGLRSGGARRSCLIDRDVVRIVVIRGTIHLVTADDCLFLRPLDPAGPGPGAADPQPVQGRASRTIDLAPVLAFAGPLLAEQPMPGSKLRAAHRRAVPRARRRRRAYACRNHLALVQIPPRGRVGQDAAGDQHPGRGVAGPAAATDATVDEMVLRYLAAFGPASVADAAVVVRPHRHARGRSTGSRPQLRTFRTRRARAVRPRRTPPPPTRTSRRPCASCPSTTTCCCRTRTARRFFPEELPEDLGEARFFHGTALHDGRVVATWWIERDKPHRASTLHVDPRVRLARRARSDLEREGHALLVFREPAGTVIDVQLPAP